MSARHRSLVDQLQRADLLKEDTLFGFLDGSLPSAQVFNPRLIYNSDSLSMKQALIDQLQHSDEFIFSVAFINQHGLGSLTRHIEDFTDLGKTGTIITSRYLDFNEPDVLDQLLQLKGVEVLVHDDDQAGFHAKGYVFRSGSEVTAIVGSSNLTMNALALNTEWNLQFSTSEDGDIARQLFAAVEHQRRKCVALTPDWIEDYRSSRRQRMIVVENNQPLQVMDDDVTIMPNSMQAEALENLQMEYERGNHRAVIISATGTGKTILAALAVRERRPKRVLFIVHREQILEKAAQEFRKVLKNPGEDYGFFVGQRKDRDSRFVFASIQSLSKSDNLESFSPKDFDYIIIDEVHRSGASSYRRIIDYFKPDFLLGLTATPERTDGFNVFELFDYNVPYEIRLGAALKQRMLVPFHYYGISDLTNVGDHDSASSSPRTSLELLTSDERVDYVIDRLRVYGFLKNVHGLVFCSRKDEAALLAKKFNERSTEEQPLKSLALTGDTSLEERQKAVDLLERGELQYLFTVDIFNEGIDVPAINQVVMLRGTESSIIFTQQLGRGLRKYTEKDHLRVIDFIGNYANNYLIPIALTGDRSGRKESLRKVVVNPIDAAPPGSTINFDRIAEAKILAALDKARLTGLREIKEAISTQRQRRNQIPYLVDFVRFELLDPDIIASAKGNYWSLLNHFKMVAEAPTDQEKGFLTMLSTELLNGQRPHELLLIRELLSTRKVMTDDDIAELFTTANTCSSKRLVRSVKRILSLAFFGLAETKSYGGTPLITEDKDGIKLNDNFGYLYDAYEPSQDRTFTVHSFRAHVDDVIHAGLELCRQRGNWSVQMRIGERYTRKDYCRLRNWDKDMHSTMYGYKVDMATSTCPIFVTYDKHPETVASVNYEDHFLSHDAMTWFSRSRRTTENREIQQLLSGDFSLELFVKKSDQEGSDFYYLGDVHPENPQDTTMPDKSGDLLPVVKMELQLESPVEANLYKYLHESAKTALSTRID